MNQDGTTRPLIWPLLAKLNPLIAWQQRPKWTGGRPIPELPTLPWNDEDRPPQINFGRVDTPAVAGYMLPSNFGLCVLGLVPVERKLLRGAAYSSIFKYPAVVHELKPMPAPYCVISGVTKDSTGAVLGSCSVELVRTDNDFSVARTTSAADGTFTFRNATPSKTHYIVAYKAGSPDVAGTTVNTLTGA